MKRPCSKPGCNALIDAPARHCEAHEAAAPKRGEAYQQHRRTDPLQRMVDGIRNSSRWQKVRSLKVAASPLCEDPFGDHERKRSTATAQQVHHIAGLRERPDLAFTMSNLMSVCTACHSGLERGREVVASPSSPAATPPTRGRGEK
ncbi:HNH endonuclease [Luteolibacter yonseiensis]|uniref:HNH endonuclease n=2 Tax=Luteolibacter yonseiensis TaxID=1144680 RepID=A0A934R3Q3_9BACT|nr:HNH endonuclease [Luteolibacter yonseiensis]MBK1816521.1 HNH endonuclease [Luteolibacter yonseiensis]